MSADAMAIVAAARGWIGTPYRHRASLKGIGCDCLGLLRGIWREVLGPEPEVPPPYRPDWAEAGGRDDLLAAAHRHLREVAAGELGPADVLLFRWRGHLPAKHCAILTEAGTMIHAHDGACVAEVAFTPWWARHLAGAFRFPAGSFSRIGRAHATTLSPVGRGQGEGALSLPDRSLPLTRTASPSRPLPTGERVSGVRKSDP